MVESPSPGEALPREARKWAMICHIIALVGLLGNGIGFLLGPLIVWLLTKEDHPFIDEQGKESVNFQITMIIIALVSLVLCLLFIGFLLLWAVGIIMVIFPIIGAMKANEGERYRYPLSIRFIK
jgi:uncharacterized Tic20 family protein